MIEINLKRVEGDFAFEAVDSKGHVARMDSSSETGGLDSGIRPMQMLLMGLGGCSAIDIVMILKKQRQQVDDFSINIAGEREKGKEPSLWEDIKVIFTITGKVDEEKAQRACELSMNKYCSVADTLRKGGTNLSWEVKVIKN
ncbi:MAG: OsmC family protein [Ferruginibacter sp.]